MSAGATAWASWGQNTADDRERIVVWFHHGPIWVPWPKLREVFRATSKAAGGRLKQDLAYLVRTGILEKRVEHGDRPWKHRHVYYRFAQ